MRNRRNYYQPKQKRHKRFLSDLESPFKTQVFQPMFKPFTDPFVRQLINSGYSAFQFKDCLYTHEKIFTHILLVLCFENTNQQSQNYIDCLYQLIQKPQFQLILPESPHELANYTQINVKNIISQYLNQFYCNKQSSVLESLTKYPLLLQIFIFFFRTLLFLGDIYKENNYDLQMNTIYEFLSSYFQIQCKFKKNYIVFCTAHIYVIRESQNQFYMLFKSTKQQTNRQLKQIRGNYTKSPQPNQVGQIKINMVQQKQSKEYSREHLKSRTSLQSSINDIQMLKNIAKVQRVQVRNNKQNLTKKPKLSQFAKIKQQNNNKKKENKQMTKHRALFEKRQSKQNKSKYSHFRIKSQDFQNRVRRQVLDNKTLQFSNLIIKKNNSQHRYQSCTNQSTFYYPPSDISTTAHTQFFNNFNNTKNTTKQLTNSFLLQEIPEPYRTKIKATKQKARQDHIR